MTFASIYIEKYDYLEYAGLLRKHTGNLASYLDSYIQNREILKLF